jgi:acyl-[acyl-carrier-protein]-phospholipid O-acyltransferase/long-chain-fatty-acid--[acyl-carrier-protein] ligase
VELGILPLGAGGMALASILLFTVPDDFVAGSHWSPGYLWAIGLMVALGLSAGLFDVPLNAYMQHRSPAESRGAVLAATNFLVYSGVLAASGALLVMRAPAFAGSLQKVPALKHLTVSAADERRIIAAQEQYQAALKSISELPENPYEVMQPYLQDFAGDARRLSLARLVWEDVDARRRANQAIVREDYANPFPEQDRPMVRHVFDEVYGQPLLTSKQIFLLCGLLTVPVFIYIIAAIPQAALRFLVWLLAHSVYRIRVKGRDYLPEEGGALLVSNHVSWIDGVLLLLTSSRPIRIVVYAGNFQQKWLQSLARLYGVIMLGTTPKALMAALRTAREALQNGELVCIFPEGGISRSGQVQSFKGGAMKILHGAHAPVVPIYLDGLWGSIFSFERGKFFWKWPRRIPYSISIFFGPPIEHPDDIHEVRQAVQELGAKAVQERTVKNSQLVRTAIAQSKRRKFTKKVADSTGVAFTGGAMLMRALILRRLLRRNVLAPREKMVGVLLPPSVAAAVVNFGLALDRRVSVNLNYTVSSDVLNLCIAEAGIQHVLTSRKFMERMHFDLKADVVYLEDFKDKPTLGDKIHGALHAYVTPTWLLLRLLGLAHISGDELLTVIFTSGSTGEPKGVMLTHANIQSNVEGIDQCVRLTKDDMVIGILPFFHSFGYTVTLWAPLSLDAAAAYHFSPLDARQVGKLCKEQKGTVLLSTPTFLRSYIRRCDPEELASLNVIVTGAEKLPPDVADAFEQKFGQRPVEGYGCTELAPLASVNIPPSRSVDNFQSDRKDGSVGRPVPGVSAKIVDLDTEEELGVNQSGMLMIKGPNVMAGYLHRPELTSSVIKDGWYVTGDVAFIDDEGFIHITGRQSRFSKIGGEMVPHIKVEELLNQIAGTADAEHLVLAVSAVPDEKKGERLVVLHTKLDKTPHELCEGLAKAGLPNLFIPGTDSFYEVEHLPVLGSGKLDLRAVKQLAEEKANAPSTK